MKLSTLSHLAISELKNAAAEKLYVRTGFDITTPVQFSGYVNWRCNIKCRYCNYWRHSHYEPEMPIEGWQQGLLSLKQFVGSYLIAFSGGEPFIKPGFLNLLLWCHDNRINTAVTTNGSALTVKNAQKVADAAISQIHISSDAPDFEVNDYLRGKPGLSKKVTAGIGYLREARDKKGLQFPIIIKSTITSGNFRQLPEMVKWARQVGATAINFSPLHRRTPEGHEELWIKENELCELQKSIDDLLVMKTQGEPIINSMHTLRDIPEYFSGKKAVKQQIRCHYMSRNFSIHPNGDVQACSCQPPIGNVGKQSAREIWYSEKARQARLEKIGCMRLSYHTPLSKRTFKDKVKTGLNLLRSQKGDAGYQNQLKQGS